MVHRLSTDFLETSCPTISFHLLRSGFRCQLELKHGYWDPQVMTMKHHETSWNHDIYDIFSKYLQVMLQKVVQALRRQSFRLFKFCLVFVMPQVAIGRLQLHDSHATRILRCWPLRRRLTNKLPLFECTRLKLWSQHVTTTKSLDVIGKQDKVGMPSLPLR